MAHLDDLSRLSKFTYDVAKIEDDPELQALVDEASTISGCPMALVSLITGKLQLFRAAHGLPPELDVSRAGSRQDSFCQFVVEGEDRFIVTHAETDDRVPKLLTQAYGVQSYAGVPVKVDGEVLGSLCVVDVSPREFDEETLAKLDAIGARASARLQALYDADVGADAPAADDLSATAASLAAQARVVERSLTEVGPYLRLARKAGGDEIDPDALIKATMALHEASDFFELLFGEVQTLRRQADALNGRLSAAE